MNKQLALIVEQQNLITSFSSPRKPSSTRGQGNLPSQELTSLIQQRASSMSAIQNKQLIVNNIIIKSLVEEADEELRKKHHSVRKAPAPILAADKAGTVQK